jgi:dihydrofolate reductase
MMRAGRSAKETAMARFVYGMNVSLDGYVDHDRFAPDPVLFRHWTEQVRSAQGGLYGRGLYELMRYWDADQPDWGQDERDFADAWRGMRKWVVSRSLTEVGPKTVLLPPEAEASVRRLKAEVEGQVDVGGPVLAGWLGGLGLIDEYRLYYHPVVLGRGAPFFAGTPPALRMVSSEPVGAAALRVTLVPV